MSKNNEPDPIESITESVERLTGHINKIIADTAAHYKLTSPQLRMIQIVVAKPGIKMSDAAAEMGHTSAASTGLVDRLVERDMITRHPVNGDRRQIGLVATETGARVLEVIENGIVSRVGTACQNVEEKHRPAFAKLLATVAA